MNHFDTITNDEIIIDLVHVTDLIPTHMYALDSQVTKIPIEVKYLSRNGFHIYRQNIVTTYGTHPHNGCEYYENEVLQFIIHRVTCGDDYEIH
jgi:hypothetical protein